MAPSSTRLHRPLRLTRNHMARQVTIGAQRLVLKYIPGHHATGIGMRILLHEIAGAIVALEAEAVWKRQSHLDRHRVSARKLAPGVSKTEQFGGEGAVHAVIGMARVTFLARREAVLIMAGG